MGLRIQERKSWPLKIMPPLSVCTKEELLFVDDARLFRRISMLEKGRITLLIEEILQRNKSNQDTADDIFDAFTRESSEWIIVNREMNEYKEELLTLHGL